MGSFGNFFDIIIIGLLLYAVFVLVTKDEEKIKKLFGSHHADTYKTYDKEKFNKATLIFCIVLLVNEVCMLLFKNTIPSIFIINVIVALITIVVYVIYLRKIKNK